MSNQSFKVKSGLTLTPVDPSTLTSPQAGDLICDSTDGNKIKRYDASASAWTSVGSGGVGSLDVLFSQDFESAALSSFTQTGLVLDTSSPLHGNVSAKLTHDPSVNQSFKEIKAVDRKFRGQAIILSLNIKSAASAGNVTISIYDETNAASLVSSTQLNLANDVDGTSNSVSFTIPSTSSSISYTITALPQAGSPVTYVDDIVAQIYYASLLETAVEVPNITAWQGYTPTFQGFGTPSNVEFEWRQVGENVEIRGKFTAGITTAVEARVGLPAGLTSASTSLIPSLQTCGIMGYNTGTAASFYSLIEPNVSYLTIGRQTSATGGLTKVNGNLFASSTDVFSFFASIPCAGLSATTTKTIPLTQSGIVQEADGHYQLNNFTYRTASTATNILYFNDGTLVANIGDHITKLSDSVNGDQFIATKTGTYSINICVELGGSSAGLYAVKNSTTATVANILAGYYENGTNAVSNLSWTGYLIAGDVIRIIRAGGVATFAASDYNVIDIAYQGSLKQVSVSSDQKITIPTSELRFEGASSRGSTATAIVKFDTLAKIRGDAFTVTNTAADGTYITMTKAGKLDVSSSLYVNNAAGNVVITKNQSNLTIVPVTASEILTFGGSSASVLSPTAWSGYVQVGDIIRISTNVAPTANAANNLNLSFQEQDISVSVTNTLPQFSESDSSVRVDTANGYGSTNTTVRRFSSVLDNIGSDIQYTDDAANGASFTARTSGIYHVTYLDSTTASTDSAVINITKNSTSNNAGVVAQSDDRINTASGLTRRLTASWSGYLVAGDIIRAVVGSAAAVTSGAGTQLTISKVGKPNVTGVDVTPFVNVPQPEKQSSFLSSSTAFGNVDITGVLTNSNGSGIYSYNSATGVYTFLKSAQVNISACLVASSTVQTLAQIQYNGNQVALGSSTTGGAGWGATASWTGTVSIGDTLRVRNSNTGVTSFSYVSVTAESTSDTILTAPETFSTDTASLAYSSTYTLSTLNTAPVGTYITFTYAINSNTRTQTTTRPTQTDADMNTNGIQIFTRAYNAASTAGNPAAIAIQIGKGLKGKSLDLYKSAGKVTAGSLDAFNETSTVRSGAVFKEYNELTGILIVDAGYNINTSITSALFYFSDVSAQTSGYLVINASKNPALTGIGLNRIAARYVSSSGSVISTVLAVQTFGTKDYDTNGAFNGSTFTVPETGYYQVNTAIGTATVTLGTTQSVNLQIYVNGVSKSGTTTRGNGASAAFYANVSDLYFLKTGDTIQVFANSDVATTQNVSPIINFISIAKVSV